MRNQISGIVGIVWGGFILSGPLRGGTVPNGNGAYATGQAIAMGLGALMFVAGLYYLFKGDDQPKKKKKKKKTTSFRPPAPPPPQEL